MIRVLIIDDHPIIREALSAIFSSQPDLEVLGAAGSAEEALRLIQSHHPDVALLDLDLPDVDGARFLPEIQRASPQTRVLIFTAYDNDERIIATIRSGAKGYLIKGAPTHEVLHAIRVVSGGGSYLEPSIAAKLMAHMGDPHHDEEVLLSDRERQVLRLVADGYPNKQIASALGISPSTVKFHLTSIFTKLDVDNRAQAVAQAAQKGLL